MVMIFESKKALLELLDRGIVYTFRKISSDGGTRKLGKDWVTYKRGGKKLGTIIVSTQDKPMYPIPISLSLYQPYSGFETVEEWIAEIKRLNKNDEYIGYCGIIYLIHLIETNDDLVSEYINGGLK